MLKLFTKKIIEKTLGIDRPLLAGASNDSSREAWVKNALASIPEGSLLLDAGAGELRYKKHCSHLKYTSQDFAQYNGSGDCRGLQTESWDQTKLDIVSDICAIPRPDAHFDAILCVEVFEHLPEPCMAIKEFARLLKSGGRLILTAPFASLTHFAPYHYYSGFNRYFFEKHLAASGFKIIKMEQNGNYFEYMAQEALRLPEVAAKYSDYRLKYFDYCMLKIFIKLMGKISCKDKSSAELLCHGFHVLAEKN